MGRAMDPLSFQFQGALEATAGAGGGAGGGARIEPRQWQRQLIQLLRARLVRPSPGGHDVLIHAGPGAG